MFGRQTHEHGRMFVHPRGRSCPAYTLVGLCFSCLPLSSLTPRQLAIPARALTCQQSTTPHVPARAVNALGTGGSGSLILNRLVIM